MGREGLVAALSPDVPLGQVFEDLSNRTGPLTRRFGRVCGTTRTSLHSESWIRLMRVERTSNRIWGNVATRRTWTTSMANDELMRCRVCGLALSEPAWGLDAKTPLYVYCPCCGVEFGYQDTTPASARLYRNEWISAGAEWASVKDRPLGWVLGEQLEHVPSRFR